MKKLLLIYALLFCTLPSFSQKELPERPNPPRLVNDLANLFSPEQVSELEQKLVAFNDTTSTQIAVVTVVSLHDYTIEEFTDQLAEKWGVGRKGKDNGVMILIKPKSNNGERGYARISVGYGLEGAIPDVYANRIIDEKMIPYFKTEDYYAGVLAAVDEVIKLSTGEYDNSKTDSGEGAIAGLVFLIIIIALIILMIRSSKKYNTFDKNGKHHSSGGGAFFIPPGAFGGGGRSSFGGGGGFGGFGGGSFGGGGASGSW